MRNPMDSRRANRAIVALLLGFLRISYVFAGEGEADLGRSSIRFELSETKSIQVLDGPWDFYWGQALTAHQLNGTRTARMSTGKSWTSIKDPATGDDLPAVGFGSFVLQIDDIPASPLGYEIEFKEPLTSGELEIFPTDRPEEALTLQMGAFSSQPEKTMASKGLKVVRLPFHESAQSLTIIVRISNNSMAHAGLWSAPRLGLGEALSQDFHRHLLGQYVSLGILLIMGIWNLTLFFRRREDLASLMLGLHCFIIALRVAVTSYLLYHVGVLQSPLGTKVAQLLEYWSLAIGPPAFLLFIHFSFKDVLPRNVYRLSTALGVALFLFISVTPTMIYTSKIRMLQFYVLACLFTGVLHVALAYRKRMTGSALSLFGCIAFGVCILNDLLVSSRSIDGFFMIPYGLSAFIFMNSQISALRFAQAFRNQRKLKDNLLRAHEVLQHQEQQRTSFFQNTSHELRTPLHGIQGFLQLALSGKYGNLSEDLRNPLQTCSDLSETLHHRLNAIMDLAHSRRGELSLHCEAFDLSDFMGMIQATVRSLRSRYPVTEFQAKLQLEGGSAEFIHDAEKLLTVVRSVLDNAFKFQDPRRPNAIQLTLRRLPKVIELVIQDQGIGIAQDQQQRIFEEFTQVQEDARRSYEGSGLGLPLVKDLVDFFRGRLQLSSVQGQGTTVIIQIPEQALDAKVKSPRAESLKEELSTPISKSAAPLADKAKVNAVVSIALVPKDYKILIVDDNPINVELLEEALDMLGYRFQGFVSGKAAMQSMQEDRPDLILLDMMMPEFSGEDMLKAMKSNSLLSDIPVIIVTARASSEDKIFGLDLGADDYIAKPIQMDELCLRIRNLLLRVEASRRLGEQSYLDKMSQLGEFMAEVSHELKNLYQGIGMEEEDAAAHYATTLASLDLPVRLIESLQKAALINGMNQENSRQVDELEAPSRQHPCFKKLRLLRMHLCQWPISGTDRQHLWTLALESHESMIDSMFHHLALVQSHQLLLYICVRSRSLTEAVLDVNRGFAKEESCQLKDTLEGISPLLAVRLRRCKIQLDLELPTQILPISRGNLQQIALNLLANAMDAVKDLPIEQRIIRVSFRSLELMDLLSFSNAGPKIDDEVKARLFHKGFTTKGKSGTGIGLHLSQKLAREAGGSLDLDPVSEQTCFVLSLPKIRQESAA